MPTFTFLISGYSAVCIILIMLLTMTFIAFVLWK